MIAAGEPLAGEEMIAFMREQSDDTRRLLFDLNGAYQLLLPISRPRRYLYRRRSTDRA